MSSRLVILVVAQFDYYAMVVILSVAGFQA
jgi:hypothetical protein